MGLSCLLSPTRAQEPHSPSSAEAPYCDLPRCPPALQNPLRTTTCVGQSVHSLGLGLGQEPQRWVEPQASGMGSQGGFGGRNAHPSPTVHLFLMTVSIYRSWHGSRGQPTKGFRHDSWGPWKAHTDLFLFYLGL